MLGCRDGVDHQKQDVVAELSQAAASLLAHETVGTVAPEQVRRTQLAHRLARQLFDGELRLAFGVELAGTPAVERVDVAVLADDVPENVLDLGLHEPVAGVADLEGSLRERFVEVVLVEVVTRSRGPLQRDAAEVVAQDLGEDRARVGVEHDSSRVRVRVLELLDQCHPHAGSGEMQARDAADRTSPDDDRVVMLPIGGRH